MDFHRQLLNESRLLTVLYDNLPEETTHSLLYKEVCNYLQQYAAYNTISVENIVQIYTRYISAYTSHCKQFIKTSKYPSQLGSTDNFSITREEYDIVLLISILFSSHRFRIMELVNKQNCLGEKALYIGLGSGVELLLTNEYYKNRYAYDLSANNFLFNTFPDVTIKTELYHNQYSNYFDVIYMIELLEHLDNPYALIETCYHSLNKKGKLVLTTATNIPQFDHLYNFEKDHKTFESCISNLGYSIVIKEPILHQAFTLDVKASNHLYILEKN